VLFLASATTSLNCVVFNTCSEGALSCVEVGSTQEIQRLFGFLLKSARCFDGSDDFCSVYIGCSLRAC
jgi:hypothetical protein